MHFGHAQNSQQWSADFVQHLRTVHFSLVAVCVALIGAVATVKPNDTSEALDQITEITHASEDWTSEIKSAFHGGTGYTADGPRVKVKGGVFLLSRESAFLRTANDPSPPGSRRNVEKSLETAPASLPAFCAAWDRINGLPPLIVPDKGQAVQGVLDVGKDGPPSILDYKLGTNEGYDTVSVSKLSPEEQKALSAPSILSRKLLSPEIAKTQYGYSWDAKLVHQRVHIVVPVTASEKHVQDAIVSKHPGWKTGPCNKAFDTLLRQAKRSPDQSLAGLARVLERATSKEKSESYVAFGMEFPVESVESASKWGIALIIGIQLYIWIHLREVSPRIKHDDAGWEVAWIGVYHSLPARVLFIVLTVILPLATIFFLGETFVTPSRFPAMASVYGAAILSLVLSGSITMLAQQLWDRDTDSILNSD
ncbi:MAG TPA: hypothetical protein VK752_29110 [Bryobacteraceae bacterium]|jgi:hypothetical protein|nr:hypothetical protein [Bryobacteraceae bacterium]